MASLINCWRVNAIMSNDIAYSNNIPHTSANSISSGGFLFYSNNPEIVKLEDTADKGKWLCRELVSGLGRVYIWHQNHTGFTHTSGIVVHNPNNVAVAVSVSKCNTTHTNGDTDIAGCLRYLQGGNNVGDMTYTIPAYGYKIITAMSVDSGYNYGLIMDLSISSGKSVYLYDLLYKNKTDRAMSPSTNTGYHIRGCSPNNKTNINLGTLNYCGNHVGVKVFGVSDTRTQKVYDSSDNVTRKLDGNSGVITTFELTVNNTLKSSKRLRIGIGGVCGHLIVAVKMGNQYYYRNWIPSWNIQSGIDLGTIPTESSSKVEFDMILGSMCAKEIVFIVDEY